MPRLVSLRLVPHAVVIALLMAGCIAGEKLEAANDGDGDGDVNINNNYDFGAPNPDDVVADSPPAPDSASDATAPPDLVDDVAPDTGRPAMDIDWSGTFVGVIDLVIPGISSSALDVDGDLDFVVMEVDGRYVVNGTLDGMGDAEGYAEIVGTYDPGAKVFTTEIRDGVVDYFGLIDIYFTGTLSGSQGTNGNLSGVWEGTATGNSYGTESDASGSGTWEAERVK